MMKSLRRVALAAALLLVPGAAAAAVTIQGKLSGADKLLNPVWNEAKEPTSHRYSFREFSAAVPPEHRILRGFLPKELCIAVLADAGKAEKVPLRVVVAGGRTTPVTLVVPEGQQIQFENRDPFHHHLYETTGKGGFPEGKMLADKSVNWTAPGPGTYEIRDRRFPSLRSWIVVEPRTLTVAYPNLKGEFAVSLEPGSYTLRGYHNGNKVGEDLAIEVKPAPQTQLLTAPLVVGAKEAKKDDKKAGDEAPKEGKP